ncbi:plasmid mobilization protein [Streptomyces sp. NBC_01262]|uniref:plasmid mobilization protein n=1 Tax=Streptomyces sp. NBC_01262 TaxID=2903803 RepID=UPI002E380B60|nr:hypothetical protein [Streptomyces sp. NBC_01262]
MAAKRFSISTTPEMHALIKEHAENAGLDVSAYLVAAAIQQITHDVHVRAVFADLDSAINDLEGRAAALPPEPAGATPALTEQERREVDEIAALISGASGDTGRQGHAA